MFQFKSSSHPSVKAFVDVFCPVSWWMEKGRHNRGLNAGQHDLQSHALPLSYCTVGKKRFLFAITRGFSILEYNKTSKLLQYTYISHKSNKKKKIQLNP